MHTDVNMDAIAHGCCTNTVKESKLKVDLEKNGSPDLPHREVGRIYLRLSSPVSYQLSETPSQY